MRLMIVTETALLMGPLVGLLGWLALRRKPRVLLGTAVLEVTSLLLATVALRMGWSLRGALADFVLGAVLYAMFAHLTWSSLSIGRRFYRVLLLTLGVVPIALGLLSATIAWFGVDAWVSQANEQLVSRRLQTETAIWEVRGVMYGHATTAVNGLRLTTYRTPSAFPFVEFRALSMRFDSDDYELKGIRTSLERSAEGLVVTVLVENKPISSRVLPLPK